MAVCVEGVQQGSAAQAAGLRGGMQLISINGHLLYDGLDYEFYSAGESLLLVLQDENGRREVCVQKQAYQPLGCTFASYLIDKQHSCQNACVFCFVDQLPKGLRAPLYFKDDDERLSFLFGNYITLTNLSPREVQRIIDMRISPVNVSVHTTNPELRVRMMKNKNAGKSLDILKQLAEAGIAMNFQLVLCPGWNDGPELQRSIRDLAALRPYVESIAAVPVGLTRYREGLPFLKSYDAASAAAQLEFLLTAGDKFAQEGGARLVYPSDEWFLLAGRAIPDADFYDGYPQLENGVGMWRLLEDEFCEALKELRGDKKKRAVDMATGILAAPLLEKLAAALMKKYPQTSVRVHSIHNHFFGPGITVAGLLCGQDVIAQLQGKLHSATLLLPADMLRADGDVMLDETTPAKLEAVLGVRVQMVPNSGEGLLKAILE